MFIKFILKFIISIGLFVGLQQLIELKTHGFYLQKILATDLPYQARWETPALTSVEQSKIDELLSQPYRFIGAGSECFAFASDDGKAVIKFFKLDHARPVYLHRGIFFEDHSEFAATLSNHPLTRLCLPPLFNQALRRFLGMREFRIDRTFSSLKLAFDALKEETGLIYLHLNPTERFHKSLTIYDSCGIAHQVDLDTTKFFMQKKAIPFERHFALLKQKGEHDLAKASIDSLIDMILDRCKKGFADRDIATKNFGYIGTQAIEIDCGSFLKKEKIADPWIYKQELFYATLRLKRYFAKRYPEMVEHLEKRVHDEVCSQQP